MKIWHKFYIIIFLILPTINASAQAPVNPNASKEAKALLQYLYEVNDKGIITGEHNEQENPTGWDDKLKSKNGNVEPAIWGNDFRYGDHIQHRQKWINEAIHQHKSKGKIITIMYHQVRPMDDETADWNSVQGEVSYDEFENLLTEGHQLNDAWKVKMDSIAFYLRQLQDENIPVLFRPYHEMNGDWFWWGGKAAGNQFKRLYRMTYHYLANSKGLNNLLWVLNFDDLNDNFSAYDPGSNYVDAYATDIYHAKFSQSHHEALSKFAKGKPIGMGEVGEMISLEKIITDYPDYVWFMGWRKLFVEDNAAEILKNVFEDDYAINAADLPKF